MLNETQAVLSQLQEGQAQMARYLPGILEQFHALARSISQERTLTPKFKELIAVAVAVAIRCQPCIAHHVKRALEQGATTAEILEACSVAVMMGGGPSIAYSSYVVKALKDFGALEQKE
ncbi:MAG: carboxymuconolactone decarboxylase family protein [Bacillota bacterium]|nr:carboxymuconolactone decarboxylase family protein [Bacillota bacterium]